MGEAKRQKAKGLGGRKPNPDPPEPLKRHVLAMMDRRIERRPGGEFVFSDHSAKPNTYASADLKTLYIWDGVSIRRVDKQRRTSDNARPTPA